MKKYFLLILSFLILPFAYASTTANYIQVASQSSPNPVIKDSSLFQDSNGNIAIGSTVPAGNLDIEGTLNNTVFYGNGANSFFQNNISNPQSLGNVGIGTNNPASYFEVSGGTMPGVSGTSVALSPKALGSLNVMKIAANLYQDNIALGNASTTLQAGGPTFMTFETIDNNFLARFATLPNEFVIESGLNNASLGLGANLKPQITMLSNTNVGIGTVWPVGGLDVEGTVLPDILQGNRGQNVGIGSFNPNAFLDVEQSGSLTPNVLGVANVGVKFGFGNNIGFAERVNGSAATFAWFEDSIQNVGKIISNQSPNVFNIEGGNGYTLGLGTNGVVMTIGTANVGIGTINPAAKLDVNGTVRSTGFYQTGSIINNFTGNVGIGSPNPGTALDVQGSIRASNISGVSTGTILCKNAAGGIGTCSGTIVGLLCTCN